MSNNDSNTPIPKKFKDLKDDDLFNILKFIAYDKKTSRSFASINKNTNEVYKNKIDIAKKENKEEAYDPEDIHPAFGEKVLIEPELLLDFLFKYYNYNPHQQEQFDDENIKYFNNLKALYNENKFE